MALDIIDLFAGAGGFSYGFINYDQASFETVLAIDNDLAACNTYNLNLGNHCLNVDIEKWLSENEVPAADIVIGGPPCQGFSLLNKNRTDDIRRALWEPYMDIVELSGAKVFVMENVQGLLKSEEFKKIVDRAKMLNFTVNYGLLNMADYGVPQTRKRAVVIAHKENAFNEKKLTAFPPYPTHNHPKNGFLLLHWKTVKDAIYDLLPPEGTEPREVDPPYDLHFGRNPTELSMRRYLTIPPGGNRFDLQERAPEITPKCWLNKPTGGTDLFGRLWWDRPSVTIRTEFFKPEKGRYLHPDQHRPITHREAARIMTFPDNFRFTGTKVEIARQIGNAVPPLFAHHIAKHVKEIFDVERLVNVA